MSMVSVHSVVMYDTEDQAASIGVADNLAFQELAALGAGVANDATCTMAPNSPVVQGVGTATSVAYVPSLVIY